MLKERLALANKVASQVHEAEAALDTAIAKIGVLVSSLPEAQAAAKLSSVTGDVAFGHLQGAVRGLFDSRSNLVALHNELASVKDRMGLRQFVIVGTGDLGKLVPEPSGIAVADEPTAITKAA